MCRTHFSLTGICVLVMFLAIGCARVNYVGRSLEPTTQVDVFFAKEEIEKEYTVLGHGIGTGKNVSTEHIQEKLIEEAKRRGADALLIIGIGKSHVPLGDEGSVEEDQINASFLKYK